jgi:hypothetical protein
LQWPKRNSLHRKHNAHHHSSSRAKLAHLPHHHRHNKAALLLHRHNNRPINKRKSNIGIGFETFLKPYFFLPEPRDPTFASSYFFFADDDRLRPILV